MADKEIVNLPKVPRITDDTLFPAYVPGSSDPAQSVTGEQIADYARAAASGVTNGATFTPAVSTDGTISWTNDGGLPNPQPVSLGALAFNPALAAVVSE